MPRKVFVAGEILTAADVNSNLMNQAVMVFDDAAARDTAIPSPIEGMVVYLKSPKAVQRYNGASWASGISGFTAQSTITATNASFSVPALGSPIVKVTVIGAGGGGGGGQGNGSNTGTDGGNGTTTTFNASTAGTVSATAGVGGQHATNSSAPSTPNYFASYNGGPGGMTENNSGSRSAGAPGQGGQIVVSYLDLTGISTVNVTIGAGGSGGTGGSNGRPGGVGGQGEVILEYVAA